MDAVALELGNTGVNESLSDGFRDGLEVAVVYQRSCYVPADFEDNEAWRCRLMLERSKAIVCPSAGYHLAGTKKVQQVLAQPGVVERFITDANAAERIRATFAAQYSLDMVNTLCIVLKTYCSVLYRYKRF